MSKSHKYSQNMSFFNSMFGSSDNSESPKSNVNWIPLTNLAQLDDIEKISSVKPIVIFKHSTRCSISRMALKQFERQYDLDETVDAFFLDLIAHRDVSNEIANKFNVYHESPQLILIKNGKAVYDVSHSDIDAEALKSKI
jgi:bacillithiol system protein YtxJ